MIPRKMSKQVLQQLAELRDEKMSRTSAQKKISSHLLYEMKMSRGEAITNSLPTLRRSIEVDARQRTTVDLLIRNRKSVLVDLENLGDRYGKENEPAILNAVGLNILAGVRLDQLEEIASWPDVVSIRPKPRYFTQRTIQAPHIRPSMFFSEQLSLSSVLFGNAGLSLSVKAERVRQQFKEKLDALYQKNSAAETNSSLVVNVSQGDKTHRADFVRGFYGSNGTGVKVGVISDGVDSLASLQASGDLPAGVTVLAGQAGAGDEGSAMLEIVHDLAPGAQLYFATADPSPAQFAQNIRDLQTAGCSIIVDDIIYLSESPFHDGQTPAVITPIGGGLIQQAVNDVTAAGSNYFSSAGNQGNVTDGTSGTWEGDFLASAAADPGPLAGANLHDFGDGGNSVLVGFGGGAPPLLWWADPLGTAANDYDLYDMDGALTTIFDASTDNQDGAGNNDDPTEFIGGGAFSGERLLIDKFSGSNRFLHLSLFGGELARNTPGTIIGHAQAAAAYAVAAAPATAAFAPGEPSGPFPSPFTGAQLSETFTSDGPRRLFFNADNTPITPGNFSSTGGLLRQKPDITAADGVSCAAPTFDPFFGTSAAAPHAAAIAALMKSNMPALTPAQIRTALITSAIDIETAGVDRDTGAGIVMASAAMTAIGATPSAVLTAGAQTITAEGCAAPNGALDPNELDTVSFCVTNTGGAASVNLIGTMQLTGGVTAVSPPQNYGAIPIGGTVCRTFSFKSSGSCGGDLNASIHFQDGASDKGTLTYPFKLGATAGPGAPVTTTYSGPAVPIADAADLSGTAPGSPALANLTVAGVPGQVADVNFSFNGATCNTTIGSTTVGLDHTFVNDLRVKLTSPNATTVTLILNTDGSGNNFCQTVLDDESAGASIQTVVTANAPFTGSFKPNSPLSAFDGGVPNGTWTLSVQDFFSGDIGNIRTFSVIITPQVFTCNTCTTAAGVGVGGRVLTPDGRGLRNAQVVLTNSQGVTRTVTTGVFGTYQFEDVETGGIYVIAVVSKRYSFEPRVINLTDELTGFDFVGEE